MNTNTLKRGLLGTILAAAMWASPQLVQAQTADKPAENAPAKTAEQQAAIPKTLSEKQLSTKLTNLDSYAKILQSAGYTAKAGKTGSGGEALSITWKNGDWSFAINATLADIEGTQYISLISPLSNIPEGGQIPVSAVMGMIQVQDATQGWYFVLNAKNRRFYICRLVPNTGLTAKTLIDELKVYEANTRQTARYWSPAAWEAQRESQQNQANQSQSAQQQAPANNAQEQKPEEKK